MQENVKNKNVTEMVFILDRSGSMSGLEGDTIGGYNGFIKRQKTLPGKARLTTVLFDDDYEILHDRIDIQSVRPLTSSDYYVRGCTALLDAIGKSINFTKNRIQKTKPEYRPNKVLFVITTDGHENASCEFTAYQVRKMIKHQKEQYDWEFIFLGANIDAVKTAEEFGIEHSKAVRYHADSKGTKVVFAELANSIAEYRTSTKMKMKDEWKKEIEEDFENR